ncbi:MAG: L,D-transpeptidase [Bacteroidota bacterium]
MLLRLLTVVLLASWSSDVFAQADLDALPMFYTVERKVTIYRDSSMTKPYAGLRFRDRVYEIERGATWQRVRSQDGAVGYVRPEQLSNVWIRVSKSDATVYVYEGMTLAHTYPADFGYNQFADKVRRGDPLNQDHWRTPDGVFYVARKNPRSKFYKAFVVNYPNTEDAVRGMQQGLISQAQHDAIVRSEQTFSMPPMNTPLGGWIEIHGKGTGARSNWTQGCVAITDAAMDELWGIVREGTPILVEL